jgi:transcriptional regulator with XRE-family HTH domain
MVGNKRTAAKEAFSRAFEKALDRVGFEPKPGRTRELARRLKVSYEAARKWLSGEAVPDQTHMLLIQTELKISAAELRIDFDPRSREFGQ